MNKPPDNSGRFGPAISLGTNMAAGMILCVGLGYWADHKRGGGLFWTLAGLFLGFAYGIYEMWKAVRAIEEGEKKRKAGKKE